MNNNYQLDIFFKRYFDELVNLNAKYDLLKLFLYYRNNNNFLKENLLSVFTFLSNSLQNDIIVSLSKFYEIKFVHLDDDLKKAGKRSDCNIAKYLYEIKRINIDVIEDIKELKDNKSIILNLIKVRDKYYTHFDIEYFNESVFKNIEPLSWNDINKLLELLNTIINRNSNILYNHEYCPHSVVFQSEGEYFIEILKKGINVFENMKNKLLDMKQNNNIK